jgi:hypothetical protein
MILSGYWTSRGDVVEIGLRSLRWLVEQQKAEGGHFAPIGSSGFWTHGTACARSKYGWSSQKQRLRSPA